MRRLEAVKLFERGWTPDSVAETLGVAVETVKRYVARLDANGIKEIEIAMGSFVLAMAHVFVAARSLAVMFVLGIACHRPSVHSRKASPSCNDSIELTHGVMSPCTPSARSRKFGLIPSNGRPASAMHCNRLWSRVRWISTPRRNGSAATLNREVEFAREPICAPGALH
ncbi:helix-turn-helix domain-containing protein [Paraburkholderia madseniana]|uniref:helix-turn-helix domain-containing protein n=1 Tax=Paraburkholderia madseniana TaxID=2599607 RepID=UPI0038BC2B67